MILQAGPRGDGQKQFVRKILAMFMARESMPTCFSLANPVSANSHKNSGAERTRIAPKKARLRDVGVRIDRNTEHPCLPFYVSKCQAPSARHRQDARV
jgi:hypothetical protein